MARPACPASSRASIAAGSSGGAVSDKGQRPQPASRLAQMPQVGVVGRDRRPRLHSRWRAPNRRHAQAARPRRPAIRDPRTATAGRDDGSPAGTDGYGRQRTSCGQDDLAVQAQRLDRRVGELQSGERLRQIQRSRARPVADASEKMILFVPQRVVRRGSEHGQCGSLGVDMQRTVRRSARRCRDRRPPRDGRGASLRPRRSRRCASRKSPRVAVVAQAAVIDRKPGPPDTARENRAEV